MLFQTCSTSTNGWVFVVLFMLISPAVCLNVLIVVDGAAGHLTPVFELAKAMKNHNITFLTQQLARSFIDMESFSSPLFRFVYTDDSPEAFLKEKYLQDQINMGMTNRSILDVFPEAVPLVIKTLIPLLNKTIHILMHERFDVIVAGQMVFGIPLLCHKISTPCVIQNAAQFPDLFDFNVPNEFILLTSNEITQFTYRVYNVVFALNVAIRLIPRLVPKLYTLFQSLPQVPGPFYDTFTLKNFLFSESKYLNLISIPPSFPTASHPHHYRKYLGPFIDETPIDADNSTLIMWIKSKPINSIVYGAFGSTSLINYDRMYNLINGLAMFLLQTESSYLVLALRNTNYDTYNVVLKDLPNNEYRQVLENQERVRIEQGFVKQKSILQQTSVKLFLSHCGMGSAMEGLYFRKSIICMPFNMDQFHNAITIEHLNIGQSLFTRPPLLQKLLSLGDFTKYTFTAESVTNKLMILWMNTTYEKATERMSLEIKHAGGLKRAVEEIEFFVNLDGNLDHFEPFQNTLQLYQRYLLDILIVFIILPLMIITSLILKCRRRRQTKTKKD